jgi:hypothetical protein
MPWQNNRIYTNAYWKVFCWEAIENSDLASSYRVNTP